jgi:uncharacterized protein RhaS with RHS repeats
MSHAGTALASADDPHTLGRQLLSPETRSATESRSLAHVSEPVGDAQEQARQLLSAASRAPATKNIPAGRARDIAVSRTLASRDRPRDPQTMAQFMLVGNKG